MQSSRSFEIINFSSLSSNGAGMIIRIDITSSLPTSDIDEYPIVSHLIYLHTHIQSDSCRYTNTVEEKCN